MAHGIARATGYEMAYVVMDGTFTLSKGSDMAAHIYISARQDLLLQGHLLLQYR